MDIMIDVPGFLHPFFIFAIQLKLSVELAANSQHYQLECRQSYGALICYSTAIISGIFSQRYHSDEMKIARIKLKVCS